MSANLHYIMAKQKSSNKVVRIFTFVGSAERGISRAKMEVALSGYKQDDFSDYYAIEVKE